MELRIAKLMRVNAWWNTIVPQVLGWIYFSFLSSVVYGAQHIIPCEPNGGSAYLCPAIFFFISLVSIAGFGYVFNDFCDVETDMLAGKPNSIGKLALLWRIMLISGSILTGLCAWYQLNQDNHIRGSNMMLANFLFAAQIIALVVYSANPVRLKDRAELGIVVDAFYGHLNPVMISICVFGFESYWQIGKVWDYLFVSLLVIVCSIKGIRNILLHQIEDRKKDEAAGLNTAVIKYGPWRVINFINYYLFPAEIFFLVCLMVIMSIHIPPLIIPLIFFAIISYLKMSGWKIGYADRRLLEFKFTYFMNDFYEGWLPVFMLITLSVYRHEFVFLLILHLIFFPKFIMNLFKDMKKIRENFKIEEDY
jgi:4-hydroxybenzoate polyprenyltransferase